MQKFPLWLQFMISTEVDGGGGGGGCSRRCSEVAHGVYINSFALMLTKAEVLVWRYYVHNGFHITTGSLLICFIVRSVVEHAMGKSLLSFEMLMYLNALTSQSKTSLG